MPSREPIHHGNRTHIRCRRCGRRSYHMRNKVCSACGYGATARLKKLSNNSKNLQRTRRLV